MRPSDVDPKTPDDTSAESPVPAPSVFRPLDLNPREQALAAVLCVLVTVWLFTPPEPGVPGEVRRLWEPSSPCCLEPLAELRTEALDRHVPAFEPGRNLFAFAARPVDVQRSKAGDPQEKKIPQPGGDTPEGSPSAEPPLELPVLGVFGPERLRIAVLEGGSGGPTNLLEHDVVQGRYRVIAIDTKSILLRDTASPGSPPVRVEVP